MAIIALHSAATGLQALSTQLDVISNNIANANNNGFKASRVNFEDLVYQYQQQPGIKMNSQRHTPHRHRHRTRHPRHRHPTRHVPRLRHHHRPPA